MVVYQGTYTYVADGTEKKVNLPAGTVINNAWVRLGAHTVNVFSDPEHWTTYRNTVRAVTINGTRHEWNGSQDEGVFEGTQYHIETILHDGDNIFLFEANTYDVVGTTGYLQMQYYLDYVADPAPVDVIKATIDSATVQLPLLSVNDDRIPTWTFEGKSYTANFLRVKKDGQIYCLWIATLPDDDDSGIHFQFKGQILCVKKSA